MIKNKKKLGQHFLTDNFIIDNIISIINPSKNDIFIEIGAGRGALTSNLCRSAKKVIVIELDKDLIYILKKIKKKHPNLIIINNNILNINLEKIIKNNNKIRIIGNLPYNISKKIIMNLIDKKNIFSDAHFMIQKEIKDRLIADIDTKSYSKFTIFAQYYFKIINLLHISPDAFQPEPKVESNFIKLIPNKNLIKLNDIQKLKNIINAAFNKRRKSIKNSLKDHVKIEHLKKLGISFEKRAEQIDISTYCKIANII